MVKPFLYMVSHGALCVPTTGRLKGPPAIFYRSLPHSKHVLEDDQFTVQLVSTYVDDPYSIPDSSKIHSQIMSDF